MWLSVCLAVVSYGRTRALAPRTRQTHTAASTVMADQRGKKHGSSQQATPQSTRSRQATSDHIFQRNNHPHRYTTLRAWPTRQGMRAAKKANAARVPYSTHALHTRYIPLPSKSRWSSTSAGFAVLLGRSRELFGWGTNGCSVATLLSACFKNAGVGTSQARLNKAEGERQVVDYFCLHVCCSRHKKNCLRAAKQIRRETSGGGH